MKKKRKIPERMLKIAALADFSEVVADIGCDHAYISINLIENGKANKVIASDLREGPLKIGKENIKLADFEKRIETRLCAAPVGYTPGDEATILI